MDLIDRESMIIHCVSDKTQAHHYKQNLGH